MKERCQCGTPTFAHLSPDAYQVVMPGKETWLHFKAADRYCYYCGAAICPDCSVLKKVGYDWTTIWSDVCRTCAELEES